MTEFKTDVSKKYELNFTTDEESKYRKMESLARYLIDGEDVLAIREDEYEYYCSCEADYQELYKILDDLLKDLLEFSKGINDVGYKLQCDYIRNKAQEALNVL